MSLDLDQTKPIGEDALANAGYFLIDGTGLT